ncbi:unnamed protein product [Colias eurytheme]|nr:unnamed protein product [Colias eurytheme]
MQSYLLLLIVSLCYVCADPVPVVTKCNASDGKCLKSVTQESIGKFAAGLPDIGIEPLDPVVLDKVDASSPNLKLILTDIKVEGLKDCIAKKIERDVEHKKLMVTLQCSIDLNGHYDMNGRLLFLPIEGNGKLTVKLNKAIFKVVGELSDITKDGKVYWNIKTWDHAYKLQEKSSVVFENLFNGNEALSQAAEQVIKDNGNEIIDEVGKPVIKAILTKVVDAVQQFFHSVPKEHLADE